MDDRAFLPCAVPVRVTAAVRVSAVLAEAGWTIFSAIHDRREWLSQRD
jgi:hypothetical protein